MTKTTRLLETRAVVLGASLLGLLACGTKTGASSPSQAPGATPDGAAAAGAAAPIDVDDRKPMPLDEWRRVQAEGKAAVRVEKLDERIAKCRAFVEAHGDHQEAGPVLEALTDAVVEKGGFDPADLAALVEKRAEVDDEDVGLPVELVRKYHVKHNLPVDSATRLLELSRQRIAKEFKEVALEKDEQRKEWRELSLRYQETDSYVAQGRMHLARGDAKKALESLAAAEEHAQEFAHEIAVHDAEGKEIRMLSSGTLDGLTVLKAAAQLELGKKAEAKATMSHALGFDDDPEVRRIYDETRKELGLASKAEFGVKSEPIAAQNFALKNLKGKKVQLSSYKGKVVLVAFWATWCGPCKKEMPELQKFARAHKDQGVEVIAISIDQFADRVKIAPFLEKNGLDITVLLEEPEQLTSYNYRAIPALYVIDREGKIAHARTGYDPNLEEKLKGEILAIVQGERKGGREMLSIEKAPPGFGVRWQQSVTGDASAIAIAPPLGASGGELAIVGSKGLMRWSAEGQPLGDKALSGWTQTLDASDLDGNGKREWVIGGWQGVKVLDAAGELYWEHETRGPEIAGIRDLNGDGFAEVVFKDQERVIVMKATPDPMWKSPPMQQLEAVALTPEGNVVVQADGELTELDGRGKVVASGAAPPKGRFLAGRVKTKDGHADLYKGRWDADPILGHDVDGDGEEDIVVPSSQGVVVYDKQGDTILRLRSHDVRVETDVGDLDGKPGAEIALHVEHYGLVVLGKK
jgi:thiol-disulfide isomerase/thioredoxin